VSNACPNNPWNYISFFLLFLVLSVVWAQFFLTFMAACSIHYASARISDDSSMGFLCCQQHLSDSLMRAAKASEESSSLLHRPWRPRKEGGHGRSWLHPRRRRPVSPGKSGGRGWTQLLMEKKGAIWRVGAGHPAISPVNVIVLSSARSLLLPAL